MVRINSLSINHWRNICSFLTSFFTNIRWSCTRYTHISWLIPTTQNILSHMNSALFLTFHQLSILITIFKSKFSILTSSADQTSSYPWGWPRRCRVSPSRRRISSWHRACSSSPRECVQPLRFQRSPNSAARRRAPRLRSGCVSASSTLPAGKVHYYISLVSMARHGRSSLLYKPRVNFYKLEIEPARICRACRLRITDV